MRTLNELTLDMREAARQGDLVLGDEAESVVYYADGCPNGCPTDCAQGCKEGCIPGGI